MSFLKNFVVVRLFAVIKLINSLNFSPNSTYFSIYENVRQTIWYQNVINHICLASTQKYFILERLHLINTRGRCSYIAKESKNNINVEQWELFIANLAEP